ncbi:hypothetical protein AAFC00_003693 [Neodothiora populina]
MNQWVDGHSGRGIEVHLTIGYGPPLLLVMHEFVPRQADVVAQLQWVQDENGKRTSVTKLSPPLAIKTLNRHEEYKHYEKFLDRIIENHLDAFEKTYCEDQDDDPFRKDMFRLLCTLFRGLAANSMDNVLRKDLSMAFRSILTTDIMLHHVILEESSKAEVISQLSCYNDPSSYGSYTSPKVANRQLKSFFSSLQKKYYEDLLSRYHGILRSGKGKEKERRWISSFVIMLALALCEEEMQHTRVLRADGDRQRNGGDSAYEFEHAKQDCREIDRAFDFLVKLFHCKYSRQRRHQAQIDDWQTKPESQAERGFVHSLVDLSQSHRMNLLMRKDWNIPSTIDHSYKSRLVAQFLVGFFGLGGH